MKVLFVVSGNGIHGISPFIESQFDSLKHLCDVDLFRVKGKGIFGYLSNLPELNKLLKSNEYDIVHAHYGLVGFIVSIVKGRVPMVLSLMGSDVYGSYEGSSISMQNILIKCSTSVAIKFADHIIVKSKNLQNHIGLSDRISIVPNGVDFKKYLERGINYDSMKVLSIVDQNCKRKNFKLAVEAFKKVRTEGAWLHNPYPLRKDAVSREIRSSAVLLLTSKNEGSPNIVKEAMVCNVPVVSTDVGDVKELFKGAHGCYLTSFDPVDVASNIDKALAFNKNTNGREVLENLNLEAIAYRILKIYTTVIKLSGDN